MEIRPQCAKVLVLDEINSEISADKKCADFLRCVLDAHREC